MAEGFRNTHHDLPFISLPLIISYHRHLSYTRELTNGQTYWSHSRRATGELTSKPGEAVLGENSDNHMVFIDFPLHHVIQSPVGNAQQQPQCTTIARISNAIDKNTLSFDKPRMEKIRRVAELHIFTWAASWTNCPKLIITPPAMNEWMSMTESVTTLESGTSTGDQRR